MVVDFLGVVFFFFKNNSWYKKFLKNFLKKKKKRLIYLHFLIWKSKFFFPLFKLKLKKSLLTFFFNLSFFSRFGKIFSILLIYFYLYLAKKKKSLIYPFFKNSLKFFFKKLKFFY